MEPQLRAYIENLQKNGPLLCQYITPPVRGKYNMMPDVLFWHPGALMTGDILK